MAENTINLEEAGRSSPPLGAHGVDQVEDAMRRLKICPRKVLESLSNMRIEKSRIQPLVNSAAKAGGKADVLEAMLLPAQPPRSSGSGVVEHVAVKKLRFDEDTYDDSILAPFAHEAKLLKDLSHQHVVKLIGFVEDAKEGIAWMIFAWEKNGNLREFVRSANWELPERVSLVDDVARGLNYLHGRNPPICHGDLKSLNILVNAENQAIITDFGSARTVDPASPEATTRVQRRAPTEDPVVSLTAEVAATGESITITGPAWTVRWAAPELLEGLPPGLASDIWAFGWICWEALTGNFPFSEESDIAIVLRVVKGDIPDVRDNSQLQKLKELCSLMMECWRLDANERPSAIKCHQKMLFMEWSIPLDKHAPGSHSSRFSELLRALGRTQLNNGNIAEARTYFQQSLETSKSVGDEQGNAASLWALGLAYRLTNEYSKAEYAFTQACDIFSQIGDQLGLAHSVQGLGDVHCMRDQYSKAEDAYLKARDIFSQSRNQLGIAQSTRGLGDVYYTRDEYSKAKDAFTQARDIFSQIGAQREFAQSIKRLGDVYHIRGQYSEAEELYIEARDIFSQIGDQLGFARSVKRLGDIYVKRSEYPQAEGAYIQARDIFSRIGDQLGFGRSVKRLGDVYFKRSEYPKADAAYTQARDIFSRIGNRLALGQSVQGLGNVYYMQGGYTRAEAAYAQAHGIFSQIESQSNLARSVHGLGNVYSARGAYSKAESSYLKAREIYTKVGDRRSLADVTRSLANVYLAQARFEEAENLLGEGLGATLQIVLGGYYFGL
ncbi:hypothetical protein M407DRAFT_17549 [Tulasnella calospora MUT 4182]|uniref:Protein kinase domain-containing protein n=1 Tax=Tulasnella calospora MUT 4182 TaxID=1051891 RepID=A0A0C3QVG6_9AGAM|nr:hypothetical protein M407DRAFT_17549 [Tulasnella calospora MUT 4182]